MMKTTIADLPAGTLQHIINKARSRSIGGTNGYASVSQAWQEASSDEDQLRLLVDVSQVSQEQLDNASEWFSQYGQQVVALDLTCSNNDNRNAFQPVLKQLFQAAPLREALTCLVLFIDHNQYTTSDTLGGLMQLKLQLPSLQHLEASTDLASTWSSKTLVATPKQLAAGKPPPMQRLFPALTSLSLSLVPRHDCHGKWDSLLPAVLPHILQQLQLSAGRSNPRVDLAIAVEKNLAHLPQLRRLGLAYLLVCGQGVPAQVEQLHLHNCEMWGQEAEDATALWASKLTQLGESSQEMESWIEEGAMSKLRAFYCREFDCEEALPESPLAQHFPLLQKLDVSGDLSDLQHVAQQLAGLSSLRSLVLSGKAEDDECLEALAWVTQLTALDVADLDQPAPPPQQQPSRGRRGARGRRGQGRGRGRGQEQVQALPEPGAMSSMLQQLTGLRQLAISQEVLLEQGPWLPCLTQLTLLAVSSKARVANMAAWWEATSPQLLAWLAARPASLQHLSLSHHASTYTSLPSPVPGLSVMCAPVDPASCWPEQQFRLVQPCPHLPGVMEVLGE
jgi:hypothetical protein